MNDELLLDILDDMGFDGLPMSLQEELEELADNEGGRINERDKVSVYGNQGKWSHFQ